MGRGLGRTKIGVFVNLWTLKHVMTEAPYPFGQEDPEFDTEVAIATPIRVVLYNDQEHSFDEVITQIVIATGCTYTLAEALTYEVHHTGKAMVFEGDLNDCLRVSTVLEEISLHTQLEF